MRLWLNIPHYGVAPAYFLSCDYLEVPQAMGTSSNDRCVITGESFKDDGVIVLKMPCGHPMSQDGLMDYARSEVSNYKKTEIMCPQCSTEWPFDVIVRYGRATPAELEQLEVGISRNSLAKSSDVNQCPRCQSYCTRIDPNISSVRCLVCSRKARSDFYFCWHCLKEWKGPLLSSTCGNDGCDDSDKLAQLHNCRKTTVLFSNIETFKERACPSCGTIIELSHGCKHVCCEVCFIEFCFVCLRKRRNHCWPCGSYHTRCDPAPLQTAIPRRA